ncbi:MAG: ATP-binding protein [Planctomycetota bacterium]|nr:ATP-binding protein [Planctomycetota bacterium]
MLLFANQILIYTATGLLIGLIAGTLAACLWYQNRLKKNLGQMQTDLSSLGKNSIFIGDNANFTGLSDLSVALQTFYRKSRQREKSLKKVGRRLNSVLNNMQEGVIVLNGRNHVVFSNQSSRELLAVSVDDLVNRSILEIVRNPEIEQAISDCLAGKSDVQTEFETTRGPKKTLMVRVSQMPRKSKAQTMLVLADISNLRQLENMRRDFVANVSHELKTPLASIKAYSETLRRGAINDEANRLKFVNTIEDQANRLHQLIIDLIHLARIEQGKTAFVITDVDLTGIVLERVEAFRDNAANSRITLDIKSPESEIWVRADDEGLQTIIDNLLSNAIRYTPADGVVTVVCSKNENESILQVIDTGIGIAPDQQERVFERFYRVDKARSREKGGTGLGLSIVKHLTQSMEGKITLNSSVGIGSKFSVYLPLVDSPESGN